jgi:ATP-dependent helicase/nuclease subunit B
VEIWPYGCSREPALRSVYLRDALLPSGLTSLWRAMPYKNSPDDTVFSDFRAIVAPTRREEADAIAVLMRETLETPGQTAALVTPDRQLARHVRACLTRWSIDIDDSGGDRALNTLPGRFLGLLAQAVSENLTPVPLLALLQHPLVSLGMARADYLDSIRRLDKFILRGVRPAGGAEGLLAHATQIAADRKSKVTGADIRLLKVALDALVPLMALLDGTANVQDILTAHIAAAEALAVTPEQSGQDALWQGEAGRALADGFAELIAECAPLTGISQDGYAALFAEMLAPITVRPVWRRHPRLSIWGPLEARLQRADVMILGGLNEKVWPGEIESDIWMNRKMRADYKLPPLERRIGQSAHDFLQAASGGTVYLTRAEKVDGSPTVPSRWWFRLEALAGRPIPRADRYLDWAHQLSAAKRADALPPPKPKPPLAARPKKLSVTQVETWMRDPYGLYAKKILNLRTLDAIDDRPSAATKGTLLHEALELFLKEDGPKYEAEGLARLIAVGRRVFEPVLTQPTVYAFWWPRFEHIAQWFVANEKRRAETHEVVAIESWAEATVPDTDFTLVAKADRIDRKRASGTLEVIDYKTGNIPTTKRVAAGFAPQLPLEAWLAEVGGFEGVAAAAVEELIYWELKGGDPVQRQVKPVKDVAHTVAEALAGLQQLIETFSDPATPYLSNPRPDQAGYGDYDHLARVKEWRGGSNPFDEGNS